ncbi:hypothetical protein BEP19_02480 [Ammoniphilus oxalaticus]|uniref:Lipoprotein n=1 Tax=Ammoniphilus oxalaticus TaxID=66863 RepID=A0A419SNK2_9BACL|nr:hypothetical protein [Ammoniphilus oxalaticus]RKD25822.1 hypothetical protein BEP19_02480 [Ammoniphilus oxalaticus]
MKFAYLFIILFTLSSCVPTGSDQHSDARTNNNKTTHDSKRPASQDFPTYLAKNEQELSVQDAETAYELCAKALTDYYKAIWNGEDIELDSFIDNDNLKHYTQKKIQTQSNVYAAFNSKAYDVLIDAWEIEFTNDEDGGFLYLKLPAEVIMTHGSRGEVTEFLVRNVNGKLAIVDWYTGAKDGYDFTVRGEELTINNPDIWKDSIIE